MPNPRAAILKFLKTTFVHNLDILQVIVFKMHVRKSYYPVTMYKFFYLKQRKWRQPVHNQGRARVLEPFLLYSTSSEWNPSCWIYVNKIIAWATFFTSVSAIVWRKVGHLELLVGTDISSHINQRKRNKKGCSNKLVCEDIFAFSSPT